MCALLMGRGVGAEPHPKAPWSITGQCLPLVRPAMPGLSLFLLANGGCCGLFGFDVARASVCRKHQCCAREIKRNTAFTKNKQLEIDALVSHYSAIGDTILCDAPYSAIGFRGKLFLRYPPCWVCLSLR